MLNKVSIIAIMISMVLGLHTIGWGQSQRDQRRPMFVSSISIINDMVQNIAGDYAECRSIVPLGYDPHLYESTPSDAVLLAKADLVFVNGLTLEGWIDELIDNSGTRADKIKVTEHITPIYSSVHENATDPHAWMTAKNGIKYAQRIAEAIISYDPKHKEYYQKNLDRYINELEQLDKYITQEVQKIPQNRRVLITSHDAFQYYGRAYGIKLVSVLGTSTDADVQTSDMIKVVKTIKEYNLPAIFVETTVNPKLIEQIAIENKVLIGGRLYSDSIGKSESPAGTYINMLRYNTETIVAALTKSQSAEINSGAKEKSGKGIYLTLGALLLFALMVIVMRILRN